MQCLSQQDIQLWMLSYSDALFRNMPNLWHRSVV